MILVIDNYDSFTWNLVHYLMELGAEVNVVRNDARSAASLVPMYERAAAMRGSNARMLGQMFSGLGSLGMMAGIMGQGGAEPAAPMDNGNGSGIAGPHGGTQGMIYSSQGYRPDIMASNYSYIQ